MLRSSNGWRPRIKLVHAVLFGRLYILTISVISACMTLALCICAERRSAEMWAIVIISAGAMVVPGIAIVVGWGHESRCDVLQLVSLAWMAMMVSFAARISFGTSHYDQLAPAMAVADHIWYSKLPYLWFAACTVHIACFRRPEHWDRCNSSGLLALVVSIFTLLFFVTYHSTGDSSFEPVACFGFLEHESNALLPFYVLGITETLHFIETGEKEGVLAIVWVIALASLAKDLTFGFSQKGGLTGLFHPTLDGGFLLTCASITQGICISFAAHETRATLLQGDSDEIHSSRSFMIPAFIIPLLRFLRSSFRRACMMYAANGVFTVIVYANVSVDGKAFSDWNETVIIGGKELIGGIRFVGVLCFFVATWTLFASQRFLTYPIDRHFRLLTLLKAILICCKIVVLVFQPVQNPYRVTPSIALQIISIACSSLIAMCPDFKTLWAGINSKSLRKSYISTRELLLAIAVLIVLAKVWVGLVLMMKYLGPDFEFYKLFQAIASDQNLGTLIGNIPVYLIPAYCFVNEVFRSIGAHCSIDAVRPCFEGIVSARGVQVLSVVMAVKCPLELTGNLLIFHSFRVRYLRDLVFGDSGWASSLTAYITVLFFISSAVACIAAADPRLMRSACTVPLAEACSDRP